MEILNLPALGSTLARSLTLLLVVSYLSCEPQPSPPLSPEQELGTFKLPPGYQVELVASEPMVQDPVVLNFDQDGRLWVVEMLGFMPEIEGTGEDNPVGRVSVLTDNDQDGKMDHRVIFLDSLVLPRALAVVKGGALIAEEVSLWYAEDLDGDLRCDRKTLIDPQYGVKGVVEHSANGLWRGLDNWYYNAKSTTRYRFINGAWEGEETEFRGQWGISHDNYGRLYYNYNWSQLHADLVPPNYLHRNKNHQPTSGIDHALTLERRIFPVRQNLASNRGYIPGALDEDGRLVEFTSACAPFVYRGNGFDGQMTGNVFVCEPTANLIRRNIIQQDGVLLTAQNAYDNSEFIASTDERFRPVYLASGPDGYLYIADMYRGIIQHGLYMSPYLKEVTLQRNLDTPINKGRIWRIKPAGKNNYSAINLSNASVKELVDLLDHANGWYRDMAQRLLVERADNDAIPWLQEVVIKGSQPFSKVHALWTLEGLQTDQADIYFRALEDENAQVRSNALRVLESIAAKDPKVMHALPSAMKQMNHSEVAALQIVLTSRIFKTEDIQSMLSGILETYNSPVFRDAVMSSIQDREYQFLTMLLQRPFWQEYANEKEIVLDMLTASVMKKRDPDELYQMLVLLGTEKLNWQRKAILTGMSIHGNGSDSMQVMLSDEPLLFGKKLYENDSSIQSKIRRVAGYFTWPGKAKLPLQPPVNVQTEVDPAVFSAGRQLYLTLCASCHGSDGQGLSRFAPPLANSEWVLGDVKRLALILMHGMEGPVEVNGKIYDQPQILPEMPAFSSTDARDLANVMTYIRREWGHTAGPVDAGTIGGIRVTTQGRINPWTAEELQNILPDTD